jgi:hypothetical protein
MSMNSYSEPDCRRRFVEWQAVEKDLLVGDVCVVAVHPHLITSARRYSFHEAGFGDET